MLSGFNLFVSGELKIRNPHGTLFSVRQASLSSPNSHNRQAEVKEALVESAQM
jgi:hypothetical protein